MRKPKYQDGDTVNGSTILSYLGRSNYSVRCQCGAVVSKQVYDISRHRRCKRCPKYRTGEQIGSWTIIDYDPTTYHYRVMCACGYTGARTASNIKAYPRCSSCGNNVVSEDKLIGERFGVRVVIAEIDKRNGKRYFLVDCDCGREHEMPLHKLKLSPSRCLFKPDA